MFHAQSKQKSCDQKYLVVQFPILYPLPHHQSKNLIPLNKEIILTWLYIARFKKKRQREQAANLSIYEIFLFNQSCLHCYF